MGMVQVSQLNIQADRICVSFHPYNEIYIESPRSKSGYVRLDSYNPRIGEIISRKHTQLGEVAESTAIGYLRELVDKYAPGRTIAEVPSNRTGGNKGIFEANQGNKLHGKMILEVPVQKKAISQKVLDYAEKYRITIRDVNNKLYN